MSTSTHLITADELMRLSDDGHRYELVKGELLTMSPTGEEHGFAAGNLTILLGHFVKTNNLGRLYTADAGFKLESDPDTVLVPDVAFIRRERAGTLSKSFRVGAPDLAVEVRSPNDGKKRVEAKISSWLTLGASVVWLIDPIERTVEVRYKSGDRELLTQNDELTGGDLIPGFRVSVSEIFAD